MMRIVILEDQLRDVAHVHVVGLTVAMAVVGEFRVLDQQGTAEAMHDEKAGLIVMEIAVAKRHVLSLDPDGSTVAIGDSGSIHFYVFNGDVLAADDPNRFSFGALAAGVDHRSSIHAPNGQPIAADDGARVAAIYAGSGDLDDVARIGLH